MLIFFSLHVNCLLVLWMERVKLGQGMIPTNLSSLSLLPVTKVDTDTTRLSLMDCDLQLFTIATLRAEGPCVQNLVFITVVWGTLQRTRPNQVQFSLGYVYNTTVRFLHSVACFRTEKLRVVARYDFAQSCNILFPWRM
jgi:hypothetical protein